MPQPHYGPTVHEAARTLIRRNKDRISELQRDIRCAEDRLRDPSLAHMLESERLATWGR